MPTSYCFAYYSFVVLFEVRKSDVFNFVLLSQDCVSYSGSFVVPYKFQDCFFYFCEKCLWNFDKDYIKAVDYLSSTELIRLILPISKRGISFHLFVSSSVYFISVLQFSIWKSFISLIKFSPLFFFDAVVNEIVFLNFPVGPVAKDSTLPIQGTWV